MLPCLYRLCCLATDVINSLFMGTLECEHLLSDKQSQALRKSGRNFLPEREKCLCFSTHSSLSQSFPFPLKKSHHKNFLLAIRGFWTRISHKGGEGVYRPWIYLKLVVTFLFFNSWKHYWAMYSWRDSSVIPEIRIGQNDVYHGCMW